MSVPAGHGKHEPKPDEDEPDEWDQRIERSGCASEHYKLQDCFHEHHDWRKCSSEVHCPTECSGLILDDGI